MNPSFPDATARPGRYERIAWWLVYAAAAWAFNMAYWRRTETLKEATLSALTAFRAHTPYQMRLLVPALAHLIEQFVHVPLPHLYFGFSVLATIALIVCFRGYLRLFYPSGFAAAGALLILYPLFWNNVLLNILFYTYDIPAVVVFVLGLRLLIERRWGLYYLVFFIGTWNKETTCFLTLAMLALYWDQARPARLALHVLAQAAIWMCTKLTLGRLFAGNPGSGNFEHHMLVNLNFLASFFVRPTTWNWRRLLTFGGVWVLIPLHWPRIPPPLRRLLIVFPIFCMGMFLVGVLSEVRVYAEMIPVLLVPAMCAVWEPHAGGCAPGSLRESGCTAPGV
jgi:hypothetical protein